MNVQHHTAGVCASSNENVNLPHISSYNYAPTNNLSAYSPRTSPSDDDVAGEEGSPYQIACDFNTEYSESSWS